MRMRWTASDLILVMPAKGGWAFLEANATWGAGLNGCDPVAVLPCLAAATRAMPR